MATQAIGLLETKGLIALVQGVDAMLSMVQMPGGVPVATVAIGKAGAKNAALLAVEILSLMDGGLREKLLEFRQQMARDVEQADARVSSRGGQPG